MKFLQSLALTGVVLASIFAYATNATAQSPANSQAQQNTLIDAPDWTLPTEDGKKMSFADFKGKPIMLHFWGTWCPYCKKLHPGLEKIRVEYEDKGLVVLGISVNEPIGALPQTELKKRGINFLTLVEGDDVAIEDFEVAGTPTTVFISADGKILGSTMESNPDDPRFKQVADYLTRTQ